MLLGLRGYFWPKLAVTNLPLVACTKRTAGVGDFFWSILGDSLWPFFSPKNILLPGIEGFFLASSQILLLVLVAFFGPFLAVTSRTAT